MTDARGRPSGAGLADQWASLLTALEAHRPRPGPPSGVDPASAGAGERHGSTPVTIVTGFLGAGKSTLLARMLADPPAGEVVRAVVNDIGRLPFDPTLVSDADPDRIELTNGCGCCVAGAAADLGDRLGRLAPGADRLVLEASGTADPAALAQIVVAGRGLHLDRVVAVVDAVALDTLADDPVTGPTLRRQLAWADAVVLSHADRLDPARSDHARLELARPGPSRSGRPSLEAVTASVAALAPGAPVAASTLDHPAHRVLAPPFPVGAAAPGSDRSPAIPGHGLVIETLTQSGPIGLDALVAVLEGRPAGLLRGKGRLAVDGRSRLVQFTPTTWSVGPAEPDPGGDGGPTGEAGLTVVAVDRADLDGLVALLGPDDG